MLNFATATCAAGTASLLDTDELLRNLNRFPPAVLPVGVLRELQSRGDAIRAPLVALLNHAKESIGSGVGSDLNNYLYALLLLTPIATPEERPLLESLLKLPSDSLYELFGDLFAEAVPHLIANFFGEQNTFEMLDWIKRLENQLELKTDESSLLYSVLRIAANQGRIERNTAIEVLVDLLKKRSDLRHDLPSALIVHELTYLSAHELEAVDAVVRECFERGQIDTDFTDLDTWDKGRSTDFSRDAREAWSDAAAQLSRLQFAFISNDLDPINATYLVNQHSASFIALALPVSNLVDQLRLATDSNYPREAIKAIDRSFGEAYSATVELIRNELARYQVDSDSWSGNGAYLGLVLTVANQMPLPLDLLETILLMPEEDREQVFGDQFELVVQSVALTSLPNYEFLEEWIWDTERSDVDRLEMISAYLYACHHQLLDRESTIKALAAGLRRALDEEHMLIAHYAEALAFLTPTPHSQMLEEAFQRKDGEWFQPLVVLRRMVQDAEFAEFQFKSHIRGYHSVDAIISASVMFDAELLQEKPRQVSRPASDYRPKPPVNATATIRSDARTPRNDPCPCGSGKKYKKCCLNK